MAPNINWSIEQTNIFNWFETSRVLVPGKDSAGVHSQHLIVRARAGTGKTTTICEGVERAKDGKILMAAFNKSIAKELESRLRNPRVEAKTLHGLGFAFLRREYRNVNIDDNRATDLTKRVIGSDNVPDSIAKLVTNLHTKGREVEPFAAIRGPNQLIDVALRFNLVPDDGQEEDGWTLNRVCDMAHKAMQFAMERPTSIDFADMIFLPLVLKLVRPWFNMVVVDEAQDMTVSQLALARGACKRDGRICVVGDNCQAIYGFRGADSGSLDRLKQELSAAELTLNITRRCPKKVVSLAAELVPDFVAAPEAPEGEIVRMDAGKMLAEAREGDFILSRTNAPLIKVCMALLKQGRRARIKGRDIGKGITSIIRKYPNNSVKDMLATIGEVFPKMMSNARETLSETAAEERCNFLQDQWDVIVALSDDAVSINEVIARCEDLFADDAERQAIMCSSVHKAKGLEANNVYLLEGTFRKTFPGSEESNIRYVAITRAKCRLILVSGFESTPKAM